MQLFQLPLSERNPSSGNGNWWSLASKTGIRNASLILLPQPITSHWVTVSAALM